jgi:tetratricopeptide (TPR) repeat protein
MHKVSRVADTGRNVATRKHALVLSLLVGFWPCSGIAGNGESQAACENRPAVKSLIQEGNDLAGPYDRRRAAFEQAIRHCPEDPKLYNTLSVLLMKHGAFADAIDSISRGLRVDPANPELRFNRAVALLSAGRASESLAILRQLPAGAATEFYIGMAHRGLGEHEAARQALLRAFELGYPDPYVLYAVIEQDRSLGDKKAGLEHFQIFDQRYPNSPFLHLLLADAYLAQNQDSEAEREYLEALKQNSTLPVVHSKLGYLEFSRAHYAEAADFFRKDIALNPGFAESHLYLGLCLRRLGRNNEAISSFEQAIARDPNSLNAYRQLATAMVQEGRLQEALRQVKTGLEHFPDDEALHAQLARLLTKLGRLSEGEKAAERARQLMDPNAKARTTASQEADTKPVAPPALVEEVSPTKSRSISSSRGEPPSASGYVTGQQTLSHLRECVQSTNTACADAALAEIRDERVRRSPEFLELNALLLSLKQRYTEALSSVNQAIEASPRESRYLFMQGELYQKLGDQVSAIRSFLEAQKLGDGSPMPVYSIGMSFFALGYHDDLKDYYDRASRHFGVALRLDPKFSKAEFMLGVIDAVQAALPEARRHFENALQLSPDNPYYRVHYGVLLSRIGDDAGALAQLQQANRLTASYAPTHLNLGKLYARLGRYAEARLELETALKINPELGEAFYTLGSVYRRLGLDDLSSRAFESFKTTKQPAKEADPIEAAISAHDSAAVSQHP